MTRLPPGQIETRRFPVVGERAPSADLAGDPSSWHLIVDGLIDNPITLDLSSFLEMAGGELEADIHCVTSWSRFDVTWTGIPLAHLLGPTGVQDRARFVSFESYSSRDHHTSLPLEVALADSWMVHSLNGEPLSLDHGGPVRVFTSGRYFYKSIKWLRRVVLLAEDRLGWWEVNSAYHNNADPTSGKERFTTGSLRPDQLQRFLDAPNYDKYRGRVLLGLDLREWTPASTDLRRLQLKNCDLRGVDLSGADLSSSNLSLSDLRDANLTGADLSGSDLEGANLAGADLSAVDFSGCRLSATRFVDADLAALVDGAVFGGVWGLIEDQEAFLRSQGLEIEVL